MADGDAAHVLTIIRSVSGGEVARFSLGVSTTVGEVRELLAPAVGSRPAALRLMRFGELLPADDTLEEAGASPGGSLDIQLIISDGRGPEEKLRDANSRGFERARTEVLGFSVPGEDPREAAARRGGTYVVQDVTTGDRYRVRCSAGDERAGAAAWAVDVSAMGEEEDDP
mmetsp:Transcript_60534/g.170566  ORF Transcript_60534/g.170566 Transcript_60534/m.170566 type:complete len:170 (+) Transcript_60534:76-585(+)